MNYGQKRKLRSRLMAVVISILSCIAVMSIGVYAASKQFSVTVANEVSLEFIKVDGYLWGKRSGNCVYNGDIGTPTVLENQVSAVTDGYLLLYDYLDRENAQNAQNIAEIEKRVNVEETKDNVDKDGNLKITYVFKYEFLKDSSIDVQITLTDTSTKFASGDNRDDMVKLNYRYIFAENEPDWANNNTLGNEMTFNNVGACNILIDAGDKSIETDHYSRVDLQNANTYTVYILAELVLPTTDTLASAFTLGVHDEYFWAFSLRLTNVNY